MATLSTAARNAACNAIVDLLDAGASAGVLEFQTAGGTEVATLTFSDPAFGDAVDGTATAAAITADNNVTGGITTQAVLKNSNGDVVLTATVATSGADINLTSTSLAATESLSVTSLTVTVPAS